MGKEDQGVFAHWMLAFHYRRPLSYLGFGGNGKQVRDLLHVSDLAELVDDQLERADHWAGAVVNVGGGAGVSLSLLETSRLCREIVGHDLEIAHDPRTRAGDVRIYVSDCRALERFSDWRPRHSPAETLADIHVWIHDHERALRGALADA
jgi:CDP-paratose 2-epimerase